jgi:hypothetical protein
MCTENKKCLVHLIGEKFDEIKSMFFDEFGAEVGKIDDKLPEALKGEIDSLRDRIVICAAILEAQKEGFPITVEAVHAKTPEEAVEKFKKRQDELNKKEKAPNPNLH